MTLSDIKTNPLKILEAASRPEPGGGTALDLHAMAAALVAGFKIAGYSLATLHNAVDEVWPEVEVSHGICPDCAARAPH